MPTHRETSYRRNLFPELLDKRLSELTMGQKEDAHEDWIRSQYPALGKEHIPFLLTRLDELRERIDKAADLVDTELKRYMELKR